MVVLETAQYWSLKVQQARGVTIILIQMAGLSFIKRTGEGTGKMPLVWVFLQGLGSLQCVFLGEIIVLWYIWNLRIQSNPSPRNNFICKANLVLQRRGSSGRCGSPYLTLGALATNPHLKASPVNVEPIVLIVLNQPELKTNSHKTQHQPKVPVQKDMHRIAEHTDSTWKRFFLPKLKLWSLFWSLPCVCVCV